jgi:hypothetical protein
VLALHRDREAFVALPEIHTPTFRVWSDASTAVRHSGGGKSNKQQQDQTMKRIIPSILALCASAAFAADKVETTTVKTVTTTGTLHEYVPGKTFIVKETSGPVEYTYAPKVIYTTKSGRVLTDAELARRMKVGIPVWVHSFDENGKRTITKIEVEDGD